MLFFLYGEDSFRSQKKLNTLKEKFIREVDKSGVNLTECDGENLDIDKFTQIFSTPPFIARKRMVIVKSLLRKNKDKNIQKEIAKLLDKQNNDDKIIIFWEDATKEKRKKKAPFSGALFNKLIKSKFSQEFTPLQGQILNKWILKEIEAQNGKIQTQAINILATFIGSDLWQMTNEIKKLASFTLGREITAEDVTLLVKGKFNDEIFALTDMIGTKNKKAALKLLDEQLKNNTPEILILASIINQFRNLIQVREILEDNTFPTRDMVVSQVGLHPFVATKSIEQARNYSMDNLKTIYTRLLKIDRKLKTGQTKGRILFDLLVMGL